MFAREFVLREQALHLGWNARDQRARRHLDAARREGARGVTMARSPISALSMTPAFMPTMASRRTTQPWRTEPCPMCPCASTRVCAPGKLCSTQGPARWRPPPGRSGQSRRAGKRRARHDNLGRRSRRRSHRRGMHVGAGIDKRDDSVNGITGHLRRSRLLRTGSCARFVLCIAGFVYCPSAGPHRTIRPPDQANLPGWAIPQAAQRQPIRATARRARRGTTGDDHDNAGQDHFQRRS